MGWTAPNTVATNDVLSAAMWNTYVRDNFLSGATWVAYPATLTASTSNPALGSTGTITGRWARLGNTIWWAVDIVAGGSGISAGSGTYAVSFPVSPRGGHLSLGNGWGYTAAGWVSLQVQSSGGLVMGSTGQMSHTTGITAAAQTIGLSGVYESA